MPEYFWQMVMMHNEIEAETPKSNPTRRMEAYKKDVRAVPLRLYSLGCWIGQSTPSNRGPAVASAFTPSSFDFRSFQVEEGQKRQEVEEAITEARYGSGLSGRGRNPADQRRKLIEKVSSRGMDSLVSSQRARWQADCWRRAAPLAPAPRSDHRSTGGCTGAWRAT